MFRYVIFCLLLIFLFQSSKRKIRKKLSHKDQFQKIYSIKKGPKPFTLNPSCPNRL